MDTMNRITDRLIFVWTGVILFPKELFKNTSVPFIHEIMLEPFNLEERKGTAFTYRSSLQEDYNTVEHYILTSSGRDVHSGFIRFKVRAGNAG